MAFDPDGVELARERGCLIIAFEPPTADPFEAQELAETAYHVLWELVHVFFEHESRTTHDTGASSFLYPFLGGGPRPTLDAVLADVAASVVAKGDEIAALREQTLAEGRDVLAGAAAELRARLDRGGRLLCLGNGGSATDAMDAVADMRFPPGGWRPERALDLTEDTGVITAVANDIGAEAIFTRQVIAHGRAEDVLLAQSTSGNSANVIAALAEARGRGLATIAMVGYDGGRIAAEELADFVVVVRSEHIPRIQEAQATAWHALRRLLAGRTRKGVAPMTRRVRARVEGVVQGVGYRPFVYRLAGELGVGGWVLNDSRGVLVEAEGDGAVIDDFVARLATRRAAAGRGGAGGARGRRSGRRRRVPDPGQRRRGARRADRRRRRHVRRLPGRGARPGRPPPRLPVHQLHQLRAAVHDRHAACPTTGR